MITTTGYLYEINEKTVKKKIRRYAEGLSSIREEILKGAIAPKEGS
jgi:hypothetical protein